MSFKVFIDDNFHHWNEAERYEQGEYDTYELAESICKTIVNEFHISAYKDGMSANELYEQYTRYEEDPYIISEQMQVNFSAWDYAKIRSFEICKKTTVYIHIHLVNSRYSNTPLIHFLFFL
ncbi:hypothetical protein [Sulfurimonas sp.]